MTEHEQAQTARQSLKTGYIFPGQGSQYAGMGKNLADSFSVAREVFEEADDALGFSISRVCFHGTAEELQLTENTQPAILTVSVAALRIVESETGVVPDFVAGHSLGEYSANVAAGALSLADAVRTVRKRGQYMQEAVPVGVGAMAAVMGAEVSVIEAACTEASQHQICSAANINSPNQVVIAGHTEAVDRAIELLQGKAKRVIKLNVSAPFHSQLMMPAQERLEIDLLAINFADAKVPVVVNTEATSVTNAQQLRAALVRQVSSPVQWLRSMQYLIEEGVNTFVEVGPGKVLCGLMRQISRDVKCLNVEDADSLQNIRASAASV